MISRGAFREKVKPSGTLSSQRSKVLGAGKGVEAGIDFDAVELPGVEAELPVGRAFEGG